MLRTRAHPIAGQSAYRLAWGALAVGICGAIAVLAASGMRVAAADLLPLGALLGALFAVHGFYTARGRSDVLALVSGGVGLMIGCALSAGIIANAGLRLGFPLVDAMLARTDFALFVDTPRLVRAFADRPWLGALLNVAYGSIFPLCFVAAIALGIARRADRVWELAWVFGGGIVICAIVSVFMPALGNVAYAGLGNLAGTHLPAGSGVYHLHAVAAYRDGTDPLLDVGKLEGVVTFPSFHMIMALAAAFAFRGLRFAPLAYGWSALVIVSTVPIGGHYVIDLIAGGIVWWASFALASEGQGRTGSSASLLHERRAPAQWKPASPGPEPA